MKGNLQRISFTILVLLSPCSKFTLRRESVLYISINSKRSVFDTSHSMILEFYFNRHSTTLNYAELWGPLNVYLLKKKSI